ncbi:hypothetical protein JCM10207_007177 [Rhodosporidiobolus poonsookiae]
MLDAALSSRLSSGLHAPLVVLSDSLLQPSVLLLRSFVALALSPSGASPAASASANSNPQRVVLVTASQPADKLLPSAGTFDPARIAVVDCSLAAVFPPVASTSRPPSLWGSYTGIDLALPSAAKDLERAVLEAVEQAGGAPTLVVLEGAEEIANEVKGRVGTVGRVVSGMLRMLEGRKGSRLLVTHHSDLPPPPPSSSSSSTPLASPSLLSLLLSPTLSPSTLHLHLRPTSHVETLSREYGLSIPHSHSEQDGEDDEPDLRLGQFLDSLAARAVGDPLVRPSRADEADERVALDALGASAHGQERAATLRLGAGAGAGAGDGEARGCVVQWSARGVDVASSPSSSSSSSSSAAAAAQRAKERDRAARGEVKKLVRWGFCGAVYEGGAEGVRVREVELGTVLRRGRMGKRAVAESPLPSPAPASSAPRPSSTPAPSSSQPSALPFSLTLTPSQLAARSAVSNPFHGADKPIFGQAGYAAPVLPGAAAAEQGGGGGGGATVEYTPDEGDDWDDEDPDGDLEI